MCEDPGGGLFVLPPRSHGGGGGARVPASCRDGAWSGGGRDSPVRCGAVGAGDSEQAAGQRCRARVVGERGRRCADDVVADGASATAPFLHAVGALGLHAVVRLKDTLPSLREAAGRRYAGPPPTAVVTEGRDHVEVWGEEDGDPWEALRGTTVRVFTDRRPRWRGGSSRRCGSATGRRARCRAAPSTGWRRADGRSRTRRSPWRRPPLGGSPCVTTRARASWCGT